MADVIVVRDIVYDDIEHTLKAALINTDKENVKELMLDILSRDDRACLFLDKAEVGKIIEFLTTVYSKMGK